jgi:hypothetical protein
MSNSYCHPGKAGGFPILIYSLGAGLRWTRFDFGAVRLRIKASEARCGSVARYEQTMATALEETEGAFSDYTRNAHAPNACCPQPPARRKRRNWHACVSTRA